MWVIKLKYPDTYYNKVTTKQLLNHLADNCGGLDDTDAVNIRLAMPTWWDEAPSVTKYILQMEKGQNKASRDNCFIESKYMDAISTRYILSVLASPTERKAWEKFTQSKRTWGAWKNLPRRSRRNKSCQKV